MINVATGLPYLLLWLALGMAMIPRVRWGWPTMTGFSIVAGVVAGIVEWAGLALIALLIGTCVVATRSTLSLPVRILAWGALLVTAGALVAHQVPWINNVLIFEAVTLSRTSAPYTLYWNYDKALAGVLLYALCVQPQRRTAWTRAIVATAVVAVLTVAFVLAPALAEQFVAWDPKWPVILGMWVPANLLVTCLAEETVFRGLLQRRLANALRAHVPSAGLVAGLVAAIAFGLAHIGGGQTYVLLATLAGIGYGAAYHVTQRVEASILVHFTVNVVHLMLFTYPLVTSS